MASLKEYSLLIVGIVVIIGVVGSGPFLLGEFYCSAGDLDCGFFEILWHGVFIGFFMCAGMGIIYGALWLAVGALTFVQQEMERNEFHWFIRGCLFILSLLGVLFALAASWDYLKSLSE